MFSLSLLLILLLHLLVLSPSPCQTHTLLGEASNPINNNINLMNNVCILCSVVYSFLSCAFLECRYTDEKKYKAQACSRISLQMWLIHHASEISASVVLKVWCPPFNPALSAPSGSLLEMQTFGPHPRSRQSATLGWDREISALTSPLHD